MAQDWDIRARADGCAKTGEPFADGQRIVSRLTFGAEGYQRQDYAEANWSADLQNGALSVWRGVFRLPPPPPEEPLKKETAESLLREFIAKDDFTRRNAIYILAVMLERRRILIERDVQQREDGAKIRVYEHRATGEIFLIPDPELKLAELEHVQEEVVALLSGGDQPAPTSSPPEPSAPSSPEN